MPVARRVLGDSHDLWLKLRRAYAVPSRRLRHARRCLEESTARRVFGDAHPTAEITELAAKSARSAAARERSDSETSQDPPPV